MSFACEMLWVAQDSYCRGDENINWKLQATTKKKMLLSKDQGQNKSVSLDFSKVKRKI